MMPRPDPIPSIFNPLSRDDNVASKAYVSSGVSSCKGGVKSNFFLFSEHGYPLRRHSRLPSGNRRP